MSDGAPAATTVAERGRRKAFRPLPSEARAAAVSRGLEAYEHGEFYLAHEEMEPAWMGSDDPAERAMISGLIKLAAGFVHASRGNPAGVRTNLVGARARLATAAELGGELPGGVAVDAARLVRDINAILDGLATTPAGGPAPVPPLPVAVAGPPSPRHRARLGLVPPVLRPTS